MHSAIWFAVLALVVLHQDNWFWTDGRLVFGFMPVGLFYHACISIAAGGMWYLGARLWWPADPEGEPAATAGAEGHNA